MPRAAIDRLILVEPPTCAFEFDVFVNIDIDEIIVYLTTGFPEVFNYPEIWGNRIPHRGDQEIGAEARFVPQQPPRYDQIGAAPFIPPPPPAQPQVLAPPPPPEYEDVTDNEAEAVVNEAEGNDNDEPLILISDTDGEAIEVSNEGEEEVDEEAEEEEEDVDYDAEDEYQEEDEDSGLYEMGDCDEVEFEEYEPYEDEDDVMEQFD